MTTYNKLVRDLIPQIITKSGSTPHTHSIEGEELLVALLDKLVEEAHEVHADPSVEELADVSEVMLSLGEQLGYTPEQIEAVRIKKALERGGFQKGIFLESTD